MKKHNRKWRQALFSPISGALLFLLCLSFITPWPKGDEALFAQIPILHEGRVKPLDTFAREHLLAFSGRAKVLAHQNLSGNQKERSLPATAWLRELLLDPSSANKKKIFKLSHPDMAEALNLKKVPKGFYSFNELSKTLDKNIALFNKISRQPEKEQSLLDKQLLSLYQKAHIYLELSRSFSMILPLFSFNLSPSPIEGLIPHKTYDYLEMLKFRQRIKQHIKNIKKARFDALSLEEKSLAVLSFQVDMTAQDENNSLFKIMPPLWKDNKELWHSPWGLIKTGRGSPVSARYLESWKNLIPGFLQGSFLESADTSRVESKNHAQSHNLGANKTNIGEVLKVYQQALSISKGFAKPYRMYMETVFNHFAFFLKSFFCYVFSFLFYLLYWFSVRSQVFSLWPPNWRALSLSALLAGALFHLTGLVFRIVIMNRPPVATLYESILFVSFIVVLSALIMETIHWFGLRFPTGSLRGKKSPKRHLAQKENYALLAGSVTGSLLCLISFKYKGQVSMELLVPVLNTHFWLITHVICITTGYGFAILSSVMAHIYVFLSCWNPAQGQGHDFSVSYLPLSWKKSKKQRSAPFSVQKGLYNSMIFFSFLALFFCLSGTVLGGIWADQSWGRFWGWDPKENGALLIVMGLLVLLHGRQGGLFKETGMALGLILINITVALSWFGVNLLGVGLHSYGFVNGALYGLMAFCGIELFLFFLGISLLKYKAR